jgi:hypothetical protein
VNSATLLEAEAEAAEETDSKGSVADGLLLDVELSSSADDVSTGGGLDVELSSTDDVSSGGSSVADSGVGNDAVAVMSSTDSCASALLEA